MLLCSPIWSAKISYHTIADPYVKSLTSWLPIHLLMSSHTATFHPHKWRSYNDVLILYCPCIKSLQTKTLRTMFIKGGSRKTSRSGFTFDDCQAHQNTFITLQSLSIHLFRIPALASLFRLVYLTQFIWLSFNHQPFIFLVNVTER